MSLQNIFLSPTKVTIATDTLGYFADGSPAGLATKFQALPHIHAVILTRGSVQMGRQVNEWATETFFREGLDDLIDAAPAEFREMDDPFVANLGAEEITVFGHSRRAGRIVGHLFTNHEKRDFEPIPFRDGYCFMPDFDVGRRLKLKSPNPTQLFIEAAKLQQKTCLADYGYGIGGDLIVFELTAYDMKSRPVHRFADYDEMVAEITEGKSDGKLGTDRRVA